MLLLFQFVFFTKIGFAFCLFYTNSFCKKIKYRMASHKTFFFIEG